MMATVDGTDCCGGAICFPFSFLISGTQKSGADAVVDVPSEQTEPRVLKQDKSKTRTLKAGSVEPG